MQIITRLPLERIWESADSYFLPQGWGIKKKSSSQLIYEGFAKGNPAVVISLVVAGFVIGLILNYSNKMNVIGDIIAIVFVLAGVLYYYLAKRPESVFFEFFSVSDNSIKVVVHLENVKSKKSYDAVVNYVNQMELIPSNNKDAKHSETAIAKDKKTLSYVVTKSKREGIPHEESTVDSPTAEEEMKECPFCAEVIKAKAIKCKHCGSTLDGNE